MAEQKETIIIEVDVDTTEVAKSLSDVVKSMAELRTEQKNLTKDIQEGNDADGEKAKRLAEVQNEIKKLKNEQKAYTSILQNESKVANSYGDSLDEQRRKLSDMQKAYDSLGKSWRDSSAGQAFKKQLDEQYSSVIELEKATGRHQRNVGNYPEIMGKATGAFDQIGGAVDDVFGAFNNLSSQGIKGLGALGGAVGNLGKILLTSPVLAIAGAIVVAFQKLSDAFKKNDDASTNLSRAFSKLKPITQAIGEYFDALAVTLSNVVLKFSEGVSAVGKFLNKIGLLKGNFEEASKSAEDLVISQDKLEESERQYTINSAKRLRDIEALKTKSAETDKYTAKEREQFLKEAIALEQENLDESLKLAEERLRIRKETAKQEVDTSDATKNEIAQLEAELYNAQKEYATRTKEIQGQLVSARNAQAEEQRKIAEEQQVEEQRLQEEADAREAERIEKLAEREKLKNDLIKQAKDVAINLIEDESLRASVIEEERYTQELERLRQQYEQLGELTEEEELAKNEHLQLLEKEHLARMQEIQDEAELIAEEKRLEKEEAELERELSQADSEEEKLAIELERAKAHHDELVRMTDEEIAQKFASQEEYEQALIASDNRIRELQEKNARARVASAKSTLQNISQAVTAIGGLIDELDLKEEESARAQKALALAQVAIQSGIAVATAVAECQKLGFPAAIPAVIVAVATIAANIASAVKTINGAKFANGGIVGGSSFAGDKVPVQVNSGEMILNREQQANLFDIANKGQTGTGIDYDLLGAKMAEAVAQLAPPVLVYSEFKDFENNVQLYEELTTFNA